MIEAYVNPVSLMARQRKSMTKKTLRLRFQPWILHFVFGGGRKIFQRGAGGRNLKHLCSMLDIIVHNFAFLQPENKFHLNCGWQYFLWLNIYQNNCTECTVRRIELLWWMDHYENGPLLSFFNQTVRCNRLLPFPVNFKFQSIAPFYLCIMYYHFEIGFLFVLLIIYDAKKW